MFSTSLQLDVCLIPFSTQVSRRKVANASASTLCCSVYCSALIFNEETKGFPKHQQMKSFNQQHRSEDTTCSCTRGTTIYCRFQRGKAALGSTSALYKILQLRSASEAFKFNLFHLQITHSLTQKAHKVVLDSLLNQSVSF